MAQNKKDDFELTELTRGIKQNTLKNIYIFHGEERYLLEHRLREIRQLHNNDGFGEFNTRRYSAQALTPETITDAVFTLPAFSNRTLIEIWDYDIFKLSDENKSSLLQLVTDIPDYVCLIFIFDTTAYKPDKRTKFASEFLKHATVIEFALQSTSRLITWIKRHFNAGGKQIDNATADHLIFLTGGYMARMYGEIEKLIAYTVNSTVTITEIDAVVAPVLDAVSYKLTDAIARNDFKESMRVLDSLLQMNEPPHKISYSITQKLRSLLSAKICAESGKREDYLMKLCGIRHPYAAKMLFESARKTSRSQLTQAIALSCNSAFSLNDGNAETALTDLLIKLSGAKENHFDKR